MFPWTVLKLTIALKPPLSALGSSPPLRLHIMDQEPAHVTKINSVMFGLIWTKHINNIKQKLPYIYFIKDVNGKMRD